jgi:putative peptide zinc metalloprotease protein
MNQQVVSPSWYRVAELRPRLRSHFRIHRHSYRGARWYVLEDRISRRSHRFDPQAYFVIGLMNGHRSMQEIWDAALARFGDQAPAQDEVIRLLGQLHLADVVQCEIAPDVDELLRRMHRIGSRARLARWMAPLAIKIPLFDPERLLARWLPWYRPLFGAFGAALWLAVVGWGAAAAVQHWGQLSQDLGSRVLAPQNLAVIVLLFPLLKALHEFGHACAVKAWGGEVHEMGIMLLVLMPVPYVDASAANAFPEKRRRVVVGAAGMIVELFVAAIALALWLEMQPGMLRAMLFNVMLIAGISTVLFNANPLLRFDGYYILSDLIEIPNLRQRAQQYLGSLFERGLFGIDVPRVEAGAAERAWLVAFAVGSFVYRIVITLAIAAFIATQYFFIGVLLALWAVLAGVALPILGLVNYLAFSPRLRRYRLRAVAASSALALGLALLLFAVPIASWTNAQGVVWDAEQSSVRGGADGFVVKVLARPGGRVSRGDPLIEAADPLLPPRLRLLEARREELEARYYAERVESLVRAQMTLENLKSVDAELERARERARDLVVRSPSDGVFALPAPEDLPGRYVRQGELIGYVIPEGRATARVIVPQDSIDLVRGNTRRVSAQLAERLGDTLPARVVREVPRASDRLPSLALSQGGGGEVALDPNNPQAPKTLQTHFEFEVELLSVRPLGAGGRVYVRFDHPHETVAQQAWRLLQQVFLQHFSKL